MAEEYRRGSDEIIHHMATNIELILQEQRNHTEWQKKHETDDKEKFDALDTQMTTANNEILVAKTKVGTVGWMLGGAFTIITGMLEFVRWSWKK